MNPGQLKPDLRYWLALHQATALSASRLASLVREFGGAAEIFAADAGRLRAAGLPPEAVAQLQTAQESFDLLDEQIYSLSEEAVGVLTLSDDDYPANLRMVADAPIVLFTRGPLIEEDRKAIGIAGSRKASEQGVAVAHAIAVHLAQAGLTIVSGMAQGIDSAAHAGALDAGGRTIGVLGCGIRARLSPQAGKLGRRVINQGALISETLPNARTTVAALFARDRIISGLSLAVVIIEAAAESGTMDTARHARKQKRPIFVVDWGSRDDARAGNRMLIEQGCQPLPASDPQQAAGLVIERLSSAGGPSLQLALF
jgi:DNA processing protein